MFCPVRDSPRIPRYINDMGKDLVREIRLALEKVEDWSDDQQQLALDILLWISDKDEDDFELTPEEWADLEEAQAEADRGEFVPEEEMEAFFAKYRR